METEFDIVKKKLQWPNEKLIIVCQTAVNE